MHSSTTLRTSEAILSTLYSSNKPVATNEGTTDMMMPSIAELAYIGWSGHFLPGFTFGRPAWHISSLPMLPQLPVTQTFDRKEWANNGCPCPVSKFASANHPDNTETLGKFYATQPTKNDFAEASTLYQNTCQCLKNNYAKGYPKERNFASTNGRSSPENEIEKQAEQPFLKFGVRAILSKHSMTKVQTNKDANYIDCHKHTPFSPEKKMQNAYGSGSYIDSQDSYSQRISHHPILPWLPGTVRSKNRRGMLRRAVFSDVQRKTLEKKFQQQRYIGKPDRKKLAAKLGLKDSQVKIWFQNRRMKWRNSKEREMLNTMEVVSGTPARPASCDDTTPDDSVCRR